MNKAPIFISPPTFRDYKDFQIGSAYASGWNDAMDAIFPEEAEKRRIEQLKKNLHVLPEEVSGDDQAGSA